MLRIEDRYRKYQITSPQASNPRINMTRMKAISIILCYKHVFSTGCISLHIKSYQHGKKIVGSPNFRGFLPLGNKQSVHKNPKE